MTTTLVTALEISGPWSLRASQRFWEGFTPTAVSPGRNPDVLDASFLSEDDWQPASASVTQEGSTARIEVTGNGDLDAAAAQIARFLSLDVDATGWPAVGERDPIIGAAQQVLRGFRPCGFHSPYDAAVWAVLSQRTRVAVAAVLRRQLIRAEGEANALPAPARLIDAVQTGRLRLPGRKVEYLAAVAEAALDGLLSGPLLRGLPEETARAQLQTITGIGPFGADLILIRGANSVDVLPRAERRLDAETAALYGPDANLATVSENWRPFRSWAAVHLRALRENRLHEMS